ncbi:hypothetical protein BH10ACT7_BH10ACT7_23920 [soil metagenome]
MAEQQTNDIELGAPSELERAARGASLLVGLPAAPPADPDLHRVLAAIPKRFGVSAASPIFQALAHWPHFLVAAWDAYEPLIDTPRYREAIALVSAPTVAVAAGATAASPERVREYLDLQQSMLPELLLLATAWYGAARGLGPVDAPAATTVSERALRTTALAPGAASPELDWALGAIAAAHGHPRVLSIYRVIGGDPRFLIGATPALLDAIASPEYAVAKKDLLDAVAAAAHVLDMPAVVSTEEGPLEILALFRNTMIPPLVLDTAILARML